MENNETFVPEAVTENVEHTTEETPKTYTEAEFNAKLDEVLGKKLARREAKIRKEYDRKYGGLVDTLRAGTGKESVEELNDTFAKFYESKGIKINKTPTDYSEQDVETLATADAEEFIRGGFEDVVEEAERLKEIGVERMTAREKATFKKLAEYVKNTEQSNELAKIGVTEDVYNSPEFQEYASMFKESTPISKIYENYAKTLPKKEFKTIGSIKNSAQDNGIKEYYSPEEAKKFTQAEINNNPELVKAIERSMRNWN